MAALFLSGCHKEPGPEKFLIGFSQCTSADAWRQTMHHEMERELAFHPELELTILDAKYSTETQIRQIRQLIELPVDLLIVSPNEAEPITPYVEEAFSKGIPVILIDRKTNSDLYTTYIGADNYEIGQIAGKYIAGFLNGQGKIIEVTGLRSSSPAKDRQRGFRDAIKSYPLLEIVGEVHGRWEAEYVLEELPAILEAHPDVHLIYAHNDRMALGAYRLTKQLGLADKIHFIGVDGLPGQNGGIQLVHDGILDATLLYPTGGEEAIRIAAEILRNQPVAKENKLQTTVIHAENVRILKLQSDRLLNQQESIERQNNMIRELREVYRSQKTVSFILLLSLITSLLLGIWLYKSWIDRKEAVRRLEIKSAQILQQRAQILEMSEKAEKATKAKFQFFTNISHEFRTPLTLILSTVDSLLSSGLVRNKETRYDLSLVRKNAFRLLRLVNRLMDFRKVETSEMAIWVSEKDLIAFTRDIMNAYEKVAQQRNIDFRLISREPELPLWFDQDMMDKVLFNLLSNAFKFTRDGGRIHVSIDRDTFNGQARIQVEDNGRGMSRESLEHVFERFYQGENHHPGGTGLGLYLSREFIHLHQGTITVWSEKGTGTRFEIVLPLGKAHFKEEQIQKEKQVPVLFQADDHFQEGGEEATGAPAMAPPRKEGEKAYTLLILEDDDDLRHFLKNRLSGTYRILEASEGSSALELILEEVPDLILCDIMLPGKDGLDLVRFLKSDLRTFHIPVILLTAKTSLEQKIEGLKTGADLYITKPFNLGFLTESIRNLLHNREALKERFSGSFVPDKKHGGLSKQDQVFIKQFTAFVGKYYTQPEFGLAELTQEFGLSRVQLYRKVKALFGQGVNDYIQNLRLTRASQLLLEDKLSISEIAYQVGYSSPGYFSTVFRAKYHCTPKEYKAQHLEGSESSM